MSSNNTEHLAIRLARTSDAAAIASMSKDLIESGLGYWSWTPKRVCNTIRNKDTASIIASQEDNLTGFALMSLGQQHAHLNLLAVRPHFRRRGIGRRLMLWLEDSAQIAGVTDLYLEVRATNLSAQRFYAALGFIEFDRLQRYYCGKEDAIRMVYHPSPSAVSAWMNE